MLDSLLPPVLLMIGHGAVGRALWGCARSRWGMDPSRCVVFERDSAALAQGRAEGLKMVEADLQREGSLGLLRPWLRPGVALVNLGVGIDSADLIGLCREAGAIYMDAGIDTWGCFGDGEALGSQRERLLLRTPKGPGFPTAIVGHGANPGLASHWAKRGLEMLAEEHGLEESWAASGGSWPWLARSLGLRVVQVAERDWGVFKAPEGVFCNTWSVDGLAKEALQRGEMGWGSHEESLPRGAELSDSAGVACVALSTPGHSSWVRTWTPMGGPGLGLAITHLESIGLAACFSDGRGYAPTCYFAYQPCRQALEGLSMLAAGAWELGGGAWIPSGDQVEGVDELGALLMGERFGSLWVGSRLDSREARARVPGSSATTLQVAAGLMAGLEWALENPSMGLMEPEDLPHEWILERAHHWIGPIASVRSRAIEPLDIPAPARPEDLRFGRFLVKKTPGRF